MPVKKVILFLICCVYGVVATPQQLSHQVLVSAASVITPKTSGTVQSYSQTIGEPIVELISSDDKVLTQGFQQKRIETKLDDDHEDDEGTGVESYPNPAREYVKVKVWSDVARELRISIINFQGRLLFDTEKKYSAPYWEIVEIDVSDYKLGMYFIRVTSKDKALYRTFKFEKM